MTIWQIRHHLTKNHIHHPCKYGHFGKLSDRATLPGDTSVPFRCPRVPHNVSGKLFKHFITELFSSAKKNCYICSVLARRVRFRFRRKEYGNTYQTYPDP